MSCATQSHGYPPWLQTTTHFTATPWLRQPPVRSLSADLPRQTGRPATRDRVARRASFGVTPAPPKRWQGGALLEASSVACLAAPMCWRARSFTTAGLKGSGKGQAQEQGRA